MPKTIDAFFRDYADSYNQALSEAPDPQRIRDFFTTDFLPAGLEDGLYRQHGLVGEYGKRA